MYSFGLICPAKAMQGGGEEERGKDFVMYVARLVCGAHVMAATKQHHWAELAV
jgi:hypothetical protein